jgi:SAM-dependent methyltransferase
VDDQPPPTDMYALLQHHFALGGNTADIGCGAGRDVAWLNDHGFPAVGYDAASGLLAQAATDFPSLVFRHAALRALDSIASQTYDNVLYETVVMHLPPDEVTRACARLFDILRPAGTLYLRSKTCPLPVSLSVNQTCLPSGVAARPGQKGLACRTVPTIRWSAMDTTSVSGLKDEQA